MARVRGLLARRTSRTVGVVLGTRTSVTAQRNRGDPHPSDGWSRLRRTATRAVADIRSAPEQAVPKSLALVV
ncbi:hypothetical protein ACWD0J_34605 [Streptomyces sp. NPDC003011]